MRPFVINRDDRPERWHDVNDHLKSFGIIAERFPAVITSPGWKGCKDSHIKILELLKDEESEVLIFEDDVLFIQDPVVPIGQCFYELSPDWDCLYFGASPKEPQVRYSEHLFKLNNAHTTHAMLWNMKGKAVKYILKHKDDIRKIDDFYATVVQPNFNCFVIYPMLATQSDKYDSDTCKRSDVSTILSNYNKFCI